MNAPLDQQMASVATRWDAMRELVGEAWEDDLTDIVFGALYINKQRTLQPQHQRTSASWRLNGFLETS